MSCIVLSALTGRISYALKMEGAHLRNARRVMLRTVPPEEGPHEPQNGRMFSSGEIATTSRNHCVPQLGVMTLPNLGQLLMVMPFLRHFDNPRFQTLGESVAFFTQICEACSHIYIVSDEP